MRQGFPVLFMVVCIFLCCGILTAQWRGPQLTPLGPAEGLSTFINHVVTDSTGYRYFATNEGLYRYDGHRFTFYGHDPMDDQTIGPGEVLNIIVARDGLIWMALRFGGLNSFNPRTGIFRRYPLPEMSFRSIPSVNGLYEDPDGTLWVGAMHFRLFAFDRAKEQYTLYTPDWINPEKDGGRLSILSITPDLHHQDTLWLSVLDYTGKDAILESFGLVTFKKSTKEFKDTPYAGDIRHVDTTGVMWGIHWGNFIIRFDPASLQFDTFHHSYVYEEQSLKPLSRDLIRYNDKLLVASSLAVMEFEEDHFSSIFTEEPTGEIYSLYEDPDQNLWIGTNQGVQVLNPDDQHIRYFSLDQFGMYARIFPGRLAYDDQDDVIYLSHTQYPHSSGYYSIPLNEDHSSEARFYPTSFPVQGLAMDHRHRLWAVGAGLLYTIDPAHQKVSLSNLLIQDDKPIPGIVAMESNHDGWIGMYGISEFIWFHADQKEVKRIHIDQLPGSVYAKSFDNGFDGFSFGADDKVYLYSNELHMLDLNTGKATVLKYDPLVNPNLQRILYVGEAEDGYIWMSTFMHTGKYQLQQDSLVLIESFSVKEGMISSGATEMHIDPNGMVWIFTPIGMYAIDPDTREVRFFGTKEGLPIPFLDPRQVLTISKGRIATVCHNGLIVFNTYDLWSSSTPSVEPVVITRIRIDGNEITPDVSVNHLNLIELKPHNTGVDIEVQALAYPTDYKMEYSYRFRGLQEEWISIGQNQLITLPSLLPGEYIFEIKAGKPQSPAPVKSLSIIVYSPLYKKTWFILAMFAFIAAALYFLLRWRIRRIREQEESRTAINKKMAELELKALRSQMNPHFMFNSLNSIKNYILHAEPKLAAEYLSNFSHLIRMILQNSREKSIPLKEELETLILYIELEQIRFENRFEFTCTVEDGLNLESVMIPPMLLQPFIENAIWHGLMHKKDKGNLWLRFSLDDGMVACIIEDDGVGRTRAAEMKSLSANKYKSMGMGITRDRIEIMNKMDALGITTEIIDKHDAHGNAIGTKIIVRLPGPGLQ